jgi:hypothetical protein
VRGEARVMRARSGPRRTPGDATHQLKTHLAGRLSYVSLFLFLILSNYRLYHCAIFFNIIKSHFPFSERFVGLMVYLKESKIIQRKKTI